MASLLVLTVCLCCRFVTKPEVDRLGLNHLIGTALMRASCTASLLVLTVCLCRRFVTKAEVDRLGLNHLIGTALMRAYMHGYFVDNRLWHKARSLAEPFAYDTYRAQRVQQKLEQDRKSRIGIVKKLPKVRKEQEPPHWSC